ncbi:RuvA C-terminal domain-containing protein [Nocardiopsis sp. NPDC049922]|uniref:RuvA C-terminal domain-containing protein n=1 Tax=Nocardiopsis sp. NPDC049922 TaxID=3155157 RepID=UPI0033EA82B6
MSTGFRPTEADRRLIERLRSPGESTSELIRRGLRSLAREEERRRAYEDMVRIAESGENPADEPDEWEYTADGRIRVVGTDTTVNARQEEGR